MWGISISNFFFFSPFLLFVLSTTTTITHPLIEANIYPLSTDREEHFLKMQLNFTFRYPYDGGWLAIPSFKNSPIHFTAQTHDKEKIKKSPPKKKNYNKASFRI